MVTLVTTNWVNRGFLSEEGTNKYHQYQMVKTNVQVLQVTLCTNPVSTVSIGEGTNGVTRWLDAMPPLPGQRSKE